MRLVCPIAPTKRVGTGRRRDNAGSGSDRKNSENGVRSGAPDANVLPAGVVMVAVKAAGENRPEANQSWAVVPASKGRLATGL
jgi:hypothetical protein